MFCFKSIKLALNEREPYFNELVEFTRTDENEIKEKIKLLINMWTQLTSMSMYENKKTNKSNYCVQYNFIFFIMIIVQ